MKLRLVYCMNITDNACCNEIYNLHYYLLEKYAYLFDEAVIIFNFFNDIYDYDIVFRARAKFIGLLKNIKILHLINEKTINRYKYNNIEENIYKKFIINKLDVYDGLTFFMHNLFCDLNENEYDIETKKKIIFASYKYNLDCIDEVKTKLNDYTNVYSFGVFYKKHINYINKYKWHYKYGIHWLNTKKIYKFIKENNIDINKYINDETYLSYDMFLGDIIDETAIGFHNDELFNKSLIVDHNKNIVNIYLNPFEYKDFLNEYNDLKYDK